MPVENPTEDEINKIENARRNIRVIIALRETNASAISLAAGLSRNGLGQFLSGRNSSSYESMLKIADALDVPLAIIHADDIPTPARIRLARALERIPDNQATDALEAIRRVTDPRRD